MMLRGRNPRTGEEGSPVVATAPEQAADLVAAAAAWQAAHPLPAVSLRREILEAVASTLDARRDELVATAEWETALGVGRLSGEIDRTITQIRMFIDVLEATESCEVSVAPSPRGDGSTTVVTRRSIPIGPVAVWAASNFPFAFGIPGGDTVSALASGCPVIVKAHPSQPATGALLADVLSTGLATVDAADGVLAVVHGDAAGDVLIDDPRIRAGAFTGSLAGGTALARRALDRPMPMPFFAEMGGVNPVVVLPGAARDDESAVAQGFVQSLTLGSGQFCTKPGLLLVPRARGLLGRITGALPTGSLPALNGRIAVGFSAHLTRLGVRAPNDSGAEGFTPTLMAASLSDLERDDGILEECFGPFCVVMEYATSEELLAALSLIRGALVASVFHAEDDVDQVARVVPVLAPRVGRIAFNSWPTGVAVTPAMHHGGPPPASNDPRFTSVGAHALDRFRRPIALQDAPAPVLREWGCATADQA